MTRKIIVIATPRCGGTAYSKLLSEELGFVFVNEPYNFIAKELRRFKEKSGSFGDIIPDTSCVIHTIIGQFLIHHHNIPLPDMEYVFMERRDTWAQLKSYCILRELGSKFGIHNIDYNTPITIRASDDYIQGMFQEWIMFESLLSKFESPKRIIYEDIDFSNVPFYSKNKGYENITISNIEELEYKYNLFWKNNAEQR